MSFKGFSGWGYWKEALDIWRRATWRQDTSHLLYHQLRAIVEGQFQTEVKLQL